MTWWNENYLRSTFSSIGERPGMFTSRGTYPEMCAFVSGFNLGTHGALLVGFHAWALQRTGGERPELAWSSMIAEYALQRRVDLSSMTAEEDKLAVAALFALLDEYLALGGADARAEAAFGNTAEQQ